MSQHNEVQFSTSLLYKPLKTPLKVWYKINLIQVPCNYLYNHIHKVSIVHKLTKQKGRCTNF